MRKWWSLSLGHLKLFHSHNVWPASKLSPTHLHILTMPMVALFCIYRDQVQIPGGWSLPWLSFQMALTGLTFLVIILHFPCTCWPNAGRNNEIWWGLFLTTLVALNKFLWPNFKTAADFKVHYLPTHKWNLRVISCHKQSYLSSIRKSRLLFDAFNSFLANIIHISCGLLFVCLYLCEVEEKLVTNSVVTPEVSCSKSINTEGFIFIPLSGKQVTWVPNSHGWSVQLGHIRLR